MYSYRKNTLKDAFVANWLRWLCSFFIIKCSNRWKKCIIFRAFWFLFFTWVVKWKNCFNFFRIPKLTKNPEIKSSSIWCILHFVGYIFPLMVYKQFYFRMMCNPLFWHFFIIYMIPYLQPNHSLHAIVMRCEFKDNTPHHTIPHQNNNKNQQNSRTVMVVLHMNVIKVALIFIE